MLGSRQCVADGIMGLLGKLKLASVLPPSVPETGTTEVPVDVPGEVRDGDEFFACDEVRATG